MTYPRRRSLLLLCCVSYLLAPAAVVSACSAFCLREGGHVLVGKNFDWYTGEGFLTAQGQTLLQRVVSRLVDVGFFRQAPAASEIAQFARYPDSVVCCPDPPEQETTESRR